MLFSAIAGACSYYKVSQIENLIRIETKKEEVEVKAKDSLESAREREKFFDRLDRDSKERKDYEEKIQKLIEESQKLKQNISIPQPIKIPADKEKTLL